MKNIKQDASKAATASQPKSFTDEDIRQAFQTFDLDKNMYIGPGEIRHILGLLGEQVTNEEIDEMIRMCDSDGSGLISYDEFHNFFSVSSAPSMLQQVAARRAESNRSTADIRSKQGSFRDLMDEFCKMHDITPNFIRNVYKRVQDADKSHSGRLGYSEFLHVLRCEDSELMVKLFDSFDVSLMNEIDVKRFLISLIMHSKSIRFGEKMKISFSMMRSAKAPNNSMDCENLKELVSTFFAGYNQHSALMTIDERVDLLFKSSKDGFLSFDDLMDVVETNPQLVLPPDLTNDKS